MPLPAAKSRRDRGGAPTPLIDLLTSGKSIDEIAATCNYTITLSTGGHSHDFGTNRAYIPTAT